MKKKILLLILISLLLTLSGTIAQNISAVVTLNPYPSPYVSDWENNPSALGGITIFNNSLTSIQIIIKSSVAWHASGEIFTSKANPYQLTGQAVQVINSTSLISIADASFTNPEYKKKIQQSGRLLEGVYTACFTIENTNGVVLATNICSDFTILYPAAPQLILPMNQDSINSNVSYPTFQWTPVIVPPAYQIKYTLRIVEILTGQTPLQAISANYPVHENNQITTNIYTYPVIALPLEKGKQYAWQVQALDQYGFPPAQNQGRSEIFTFTKKSDPVFYQLLGLKIPENGEVVKTKSPEFSWNYLPPMGITVSYNLRIVKVSDNQTPETAINNYPVFNQNTYSLSYKPATPIWGLNGGDTYAWQITASNAQSNQILAKSAVRTFTVHQLLLLLPNDNGVVNVMRPQFQWVYYSNPGKFYDLKVIKLPMFYYNPDGIITENLFDNPQNIIFQKYNIDGAELSNVNSPDLEIPIYQPETDIPMEESKSYYWQVSVKDQPYGVVTAKSEIRKMIFNPYQPGFATNCAVAGKLNYEFAKPGEYIIWPLKNINIKFVVKYIFKYSSYTGSGYYNGNVSPTGEFEIPVGNLPAQYHNDYNQTIAIGKTDYEGNFSFSFMNLKAMGIIDDDYTFSSSKEFGYIYTGKIHRVIRLIVESPYYTSPETDIIVQPGESKVYGNMIANVRSYTLTVNVKSPGPWWNNQFLSANASIPKMFVYLLRKNKPGEVPNNEGLPVPQDPEESPFSGAYQAGYRVIGKSVTNTDGKAFFDRLVKSVYAQNDEYFIYTRPDSNQTSLNYQSLIPVKYSFKNPDDHAIYNFQYEYPSVATSVIAFPLNPFIKGKIKRQDGGQPLANAQVKLLNWAVFWWQEEAKQSTNVNGEFRFENLKSIYNENGIPTGPVRGLKVTKYGFRDTTAAVKSGAILKPGESWSTEILMQPESKVIGKIVNEKGSGISAMITVIGGESGEAIPPFFFILPSFNRPPASFELRAPKGYNKVVIDPLPYDNTYLKDTINIFISGNSYDMGTIVVKKALHRVKIFAGDQTKAGGDFFYITAKLPGAKIRLETKDGVLIGEKTADQAGFAEFAFSNIETQYKVTVSAPEGLDFESKQVMINNFESKDWKTYYILLKPAAQISGFVYVGSKNQPVANAHIRIKGSSSGIIPEAYSDASGHYVLHNVPVGKHIFTASKKTSNLIGDETGIVNVPAGGLQEVNFSLQVYSEMDITHLMGFPIEVNDLTESGNDVIISGMFVDLDSLDNNLFRSTQTNLSFTNVAIEPDPNLTSVIFGVTVPVAKPKVLPLKTDDNKLDIKIFSNYSGSVNDNKIGIELSGSQSGSGVIKGKVLVSKGSFNVPSQQLNFEEDGFYLLLPNSQEPKLPVITADKSNPAITSKFTSVNSTGGKIKFSLWQFESEASASGSFLYKDSLVLNTTIHTNIEGVIPPDLNLAVGNIKITQNSVKPVNNSANKINLKLDTWNLEISKWSLDGYLSATGGILKTGVVDIPLTGLYVKPAELSNLSLNFSSMNLGGVVPLKIKGEPMFGYENQGNKKWYLTVSKGNYEHAASFGGLPGMEKNDSVYIASFSLYSDGTKNFSPEHSNMKIHKVGNLSVDQVIAGNNSIEIGSLSFNIPPMGQLNAKIQYYKENNKVKLKLLPVPIKFSTKGVDLAFGTNAATEPEHFDENGLRVRGKISEQDKFSFISWLYHTKDSTTILVETPNTPLSMSGVWQLLEIGGPLTYLDKVSGIMKLTGSSWQNFIFSGNLITPAGINANKNRLTFTVYGDIVANNQELGVKNVPTSFGGISLTYEPENKRFFGSLSIEKDMGYSHLKGQANAIVDDEGWYFFAGGELNVYNPKSKGAAGILFGHHSVTDEMKNSFANYSYVFKHKGSLPMTFPESLSGFYFEGMTSIPVQSIIGLPDIDIDLVVVSAKLWVNAGADMRMSMQFNNGTTIGAGMDNFFDAGFSVSEWFVVECAKLSFGAYLDIGSEGQVSSNGDWAAELTGDITLKGKAKVGWGICDSDCEGKLCDEDSWSGSKMFGIKGHVGSDGKYIDFY